MNSWTNLASSHSLRRDLPYSPAVTCWAAIFRIDALPTFYYYYNYYIPRRWRYYYITRVKCAVISSYLRVTRRLGHLIGA